tara:strand:- start:27 stop:476 length:450 start_codon:yes stop_codon:yes gene_type:complete
MSKALIGAGCFWGIEEYFRNLNGIEKTKVGYSGGKTINPSYEEVCTGNTGHAEAVLINFKNEIITFEEIINHFWKCHDPTQLNRQGLDIGSQYRSVIFYYDTEQKKIVENSKIEFQKTISQQIVTEITEAKEFFIAENYHQCFIAKKNL